MSSLIAVDWGTSSLRAALLGADGEVREERSVPRGIMSVPPDGFRDVFDVLCGDWLRAGGRALICGMAGSRQGWREVAFRGCPADVDSLAQGVLWIEPGRIAIVPGLACTRGDVPDVMRGEETQVMGALRLLGAADAALILPGTHSKWVHAQGGCIVGFATFMTGEVYGLLRTHSILSRMMPAEDGPLDEAAFLRGVDHACARGNLLAAAFSARTLALFDRMDTAALPSYLSGMVIGEELRGQATAHSGTLVLVGARPLTRRYALALARLGAQAQAIGPEATWAGLQAIAGAVDWTRG